MIDLVVIGGGPAGLATALNAARAGLSTTVIEPRDVPVDKACGEGLMPGAVHALAQLGVTADGRPFRGIRYRAGRTFADADFADGTGLGVRRTTLHRALHDATLAAGVEIVPTKAEGLRQDAASVTVCGITARYAVAADGLHSPTRRTLDLELAPRGRPRWGVRAHYAVAPWSERVEVHWGAHAEAYVTPVAPDLVGVAVLTRRQAPLAEQLAEFPLLTECLPDQPVESPRGAGPMRQRVAARVHGRVLLVGDSAGYVDALTGEGLSLAFGCAQAAVARIAAGDVAAYERDYARITRRYRWITSALLWATQYSPVRERVVPIARRAPGVFDLAVRQLAR